jgi:hypothetical protein
MIHLRYGTKLAINCTGVLGHFKLQRLFERLIQDRKLLTNTFVNRADLQSSDSVVFTYLESKSLVKKTQHIRTFNLFLNTLFLISRFILLLLNPFCVAILNTAFCFICFHYNVNSV